MIRGDEVRPLSRVNLMRKKGGVFHVPHRDPQFLTAKKQGRKSQPRPLFYVKFCRTIWNPGRYSGDTRIQSSTRVRWFASLT
jgi:hypothetical protein